MTGRSKSRFDVAAVAGIAGGLLATVLCAAAHGDGSSDSSLVYRWSALYRSRLALERSSEGFPWNDEASSSHLNDRLAILGEASYAQRVSIFAKAGTGLRLEGDRQSEQFILEQWHIGFDAPGGAMRGRIFSRERVYRVGRRLLGIISDESPLLEGRGEGLALQAQAGGHLFLGYLASIMKDSAAVGENGGLPSFHGGGDVLSALRVEGAARRRWYAGLTLSELRSTEYGNHVTVASDLGFRIGGVGVSAELARRKSGSWRDLRESSLFDLDPRGFAIDHISGIFSESNAFAAEIDAPDISVGGLGSAGLVPGYRFSGSAFIDPEGEIAPGEREGYVTAWWKSAEYDALVSIDAAGGSGPDGDFRRLAANARMRCRGGFELREGLFCRDGERSSALLSFADDNARSRVSLAARLDDLGAGNDLSFATEGAINLGSRVTAREALYLDRSRTSLYHVALEFRPRDRYLLRIAFGSFVPASEGIMLDRSFELQAPRRERFISLDARIWFGGVGAE